LIHTRYPPSTATPTPDLNTLSLHDALPISTPQLLVHAWEILPNDLGAHRFKHLNHPGNGILSREGEKEMYMVFFNLHLGNFKSRSEEHTSELQSREKLVCRLLHEK